MLRNKDNLIVMRYDEPERKIGGLEALIKFVDAKNKVMVEVGSYMGESSSIFANHVKSLTCVDPWLEGYDDADAASSTDMFSDIPPPLKCRIRVCSLIKLS